MQIPIIDLKRQFEPLRNEIREKLSTLIEDQAFVLGGEVEALEEAVASYCGVKYAIGVGSGTDALILALDAIGVGRSDEVITTAFTFVATAEAIARLGARPVFVDIDPRTYNINPEMIKEKITCKTKAILPVHLYGLAADMDPILDIAKKHGLNVIEDCAQAIGSEYKTRRVGSMGDAAAFSFYPGKNLGCFGDGGMVVTGNKKIYEKIKLLRNHGSDKKYYHTLIGYNSRLDNIQAGVLNIKLKRLEAWIKARIANAAFFNEALKGLPLEAPLIPEGLRHSFHLYVLKADGPSAAVTDFLNKFGVEARSYYPIPLHLQECFAFLGYKAGDFPEAENMSGAGFAIPVYPELTENEKLHIAQKIKEFFK